MALKMLVLFFVLNLSSYCLGQIDNESSQQLNNEYQEGNQHIYKPVVKQNDLNSEGSNPYGYIEKKVTTFRHKPTIPFKIGKPIYKAPITFKKQNINWIKGPSKPSFEHGKQQHNFGVPTIKFNQPNLKFKGITKELNNLIPNNFGIKTHGFNFDAAPAFNLDLSQFKTSSVLPGPHIATPSKNNDILTADLLKPQEISLNNNHGYKLDLPKNFGIETLKIEEPKFTKPISEDSTPIKYETFVPGVSNYDGKVPEHFENFQSHGKGGDANSYVKVTNGKTTYYYQIKHLLNKH